MKKAEKTLSSTPRVPEILQVDSHQNEKKIVKKQMEKEGEQFLEINEDIEYMRKMQIQSELFLKLRTEKQAAQKKEEIANKIVNKIASSLFKVKKDKENNTSKSPILD